MSSLRIRALLVSGGAVGPQKIENVTALVHNMTPYRIGYGQCPSYQTQPEDHSKQSYASQSIQYHSAMHIERLAAFGGAWGPPEVHIQGSEPLCGHVHLTIYVKPYPILTSGGPQTPPDAAKRFNMHDRVLLDALRSEGLLGMALWLGLTAWELTISYTGRGHIVKESGHIFNFCGAYRYQKTPNL